MPTCGETWCLLPYWPPSCSPPSLSCNSYPAYRHGTTRECETLSFAVGKAARRANAPHSPVLPLFPLQIFGKKEEALICCISVLLIYCFGWLVQDSPRRHMRRSAQCTSGLVPNPAGMPCRYAAGIVTPRTRCIAIVWLQSPQSLKKRQVQVHSPLSKMVVCISFSPRNVASKRVN